MSSITPPSGPGAPPPSSNEPPPPVKPFPKNPNNETAGNAAASGSGGMDAAPAPTGESSGDPMDPTGVWTKFLSTPGHPATEKQVKLFIEGLMKQLSFQIQHEMQRAKKAAERLKRAAEGEE